MLLLVIGDLHVPSRVADLPKAFRDSLKPEKVQHVICTGNICTPGMMEYLRSIAGDVHAVKGDCDLDASLTNLPEEKTIQLGNWTLGLSHGHQAIPASNPEYLKALQRQLKCDLLITGHTHELSLKQEDGCVFLNPGSATGAYKADAIEEPVPSFVILQVDNDKLKVFSYRLKDNQMACDNKTFHRGE